MARRLIFLEPSKVSNQHIFLIEGYLRAIVESNAIRNGWQLSVHASRSTLANLPADLRAAIPVTPIYVINPELRHLVRKSLVEFWQVLRVAMTMRPGDVLFVSCMIPTALWMFEFVNRIIGRRGIFIVMHDEIEGLFNPKLGFRTIGYWGARWLRARRARSRIGPVVLDDFIKEQLASSFPAKLAGSVISVVPYPVLPLAMSPDAKTLERPTACFVGYRTKSKSFDVFRELAGAHPRVEFFAIGGGKLENIRTGEVKPLPDKNAYLEEIAKCTVAIYPYMSGYTCSLSASALDALAVGTRILAFDRPFFRSLSSYFGVEVVKVCVDAGELGAEIEAIDIAAESQSRARRLSKVRDSKYSLNAIGGSFEALLRTISAPAASG